MEQLASQHEGQRIRDELRDCTSYSGVGVICNVFPDMWESMKHHLSVLNYKIIPNFHLHHTTLFTTIAQSIAYPKPPAAAESSDSPPFVVAVFVSGVVGDSADTLNIVDDIIEPFLPQSAPHLQHIPKLFFVSALGDPLIQQPPHFPDDPDGNYCVAYHVTNICSDMNKWADHISDHLFFPGMTVQEVIESSRLHQVYYREQLHHFTCLKNKLVLKK